MRKGDDRLLVICNMNEMVPGNKTAVAVGYFDGVHIGHQKVIGAAVALGQEGLIPAVFTFTADTAIDRGKNKVKNILTQGQKERKIEELGVQILFSPPFSHFMDFSPEQFIREIIVGRLNAGAVCCGGDFRFGKGASAGCADMTALCKQYGVQIHLIEPVLCGGSPVSSTRIRTHIEAGEMEEAAQLLGAPYEIELKVRHGQKLGRTIGIPTINQHIPGNFILPRFGVYRSSVNIDGREADAITNVGVRPTVDGHLPCAETHILGYEGDLYDRVVTVKLYEFIRPEKRFAGIEELKAQIDTDIRTVKKFRTLPAKERE